MSYWEDKYDFDEIKEVKKEEPKQKEVKLIKDRECISCSNMFDCKGKLRNTNCVNYEARK